MSTDEQQLTKGLEEEVFTGSSDGDIVGMSDRITADMEGYDCEPDSRNVEYATQPHRDYGDLHRELMFRRGELRDYLSAHGDLTLVPGGTLSLGDSSAFFRSKPELAYHDWIQATYGSKVVTASNHINIGIEDSEELIRAWRVIRCEASLFLALTASSPFIDHRATGYHSWRWRTFPQTPADIPIFENHAHYIRYITEKLESGEMQNQRHVWLCTRPNGTDVPHRVERLELRVCDRIADADLLIAVTALLEARVWQILENPDLDPLRGSFSAAVLLIMAADNENRVSRDSLDASLVDWKSGEQVTARDWIAAWLDGLGPVAEAHGFGSLLNPVETVLKHGNPAMRWLERHAAGVDLRDIIRDAIREAADKDLESVARL